MISVKQAENYISFYDNMHYFFIQFEINRYKHKILLSNEISVILIYFSYTNLHCSN